LAEHDDVIKPLLRGVPRLCFGSGPAPARAGPEDGMHVSLKRDAHLSKNLNCAFLQTYSRFALKYVGTSNRTTDADMRRDVEIYLDQS